MRVDIIRPAELGKTEIDQWRGFVSTNPDLDSPYFDPDFVRTVAEICPDTQIAIFHANGRIDGFFAFQKRLGALHPIAAPLTDYQAVITEAGRISDPGLLSGILGSSVHWVPGWCNPVSSNERLQRSSRLIADISSGWDSWYDAQKLKQRKYFRDKERSLRGLEREHGKIRVRIERGHQAPLDNLIAQKREQYARTNQHDVFACGWTVDLLRALLVADSGGVTGSIAVLEVGGRDIAHEYGLSANGMRHFWIPSYDAEFARYSPGILLSQETMRVGADRGETRFDYGGDAERYKHYVTNVRRETWRGFAHAPGSLRGSVLPQMGNGVGKLRYRMSIIAACENTMSGRMVGLSRAMKAALFNSPGGVGQAGA